MLWLLVAEVLAVVGILLVGMKGGEELVGLEGYLYLEDERN